MCENIFKNKEEKRRKEDFTKLFVSLLVNKTVNTAFVPDAKIITRK